MSGPEGGRLARMFWPRTVAVVGASPNPSFVSGILKNLLRYGYEGRVSAVNPRYERVLGATCYPSLADLPEPPDLVVVGVANARLPALLEQAEAVGAGALEIVSSGFSEMSGPDGAARQAELAAWAARTGIPVGGPNCLGLLNAHSGLIALYSGFERLPAGAVAVIMQSGQLATTTLAPLLARDIGVSLVATTGNEADLEAADYLRYFAEDDHTRVIACFTEQIKTPERFIAACELAAERRKPIVMLKIGRTEASRRAARAHTGALVGADRVVDALLRKLGVTRVSSPDELVEAVTALHSRKLPRGTGVAAVLVSGGAAGMFADLAPECGVTFPALPDGTAERLAAIVPEFGSVGNPLDITGQGVFEADILNGALDALAESGVVDTIVYGRGYPFRLDRQSLIGRAFERAAARYPEQVYLMLSLSGGQLYPSQLFDAPPAEPTVELDGVPFLQGSDYGLRAIGALVRYSEFQRRRAARAAEPPARLSDPAAAEPARARLRAAAGRPLTEREGKALLATYGLPTTRERLATDPDEALAAAAALGYPVALKVESPDLMHKTEAGALALGLADSAALRAAHERVLANARRAAPDAELRGVLVQEMVPPGVELIVGLQRDPHFGPAVLLGLGGVWVETLDDAQLLLPPFDAAEVRAALARLRGYPLLRGARGAPPADLEALVEAVVRFGELAGDLGDLVEAIDLNPLTVLPAGQGARVVDCLIVPSESRG